jgi:hypothetical protein
MREGVERRSTATRDACVELMDGYKRLLLQVAPAGSEDAMRASGAYSFRSALKSCALTPSMTRSATSVCRCHGATLLDRACAAALACQEH